MSKRTVVILHSPSCKAAIEKAVGEGKGLRLAEALNVPFRDHLLAYMRQDFDGSFYNVRYLLEDSAYIEPVLQLYYEKLPLDEMKGDPVEDPCLGDEYIDYDKLQFLIQELESKPIVNVNENLSQVLTNI